MRLKKSSILVLNVVLSLAICSFAFSQNTNFKSSNSLTVALQGRVSNLTPFNIAWIDGNAEQILPLVYEPLVKYNENLEIVGNLSKEIKILNNGKILEFKLHDDIYFHNGKVLTSADVKYTLESVLENDWAKSVLLYDYTDSKNKKIIQSIIIPDNNTVQLKLLKPSVANLLLDNLRSIPIVAKGSIKINSEKAIADLPIGTGAFRFVEFNKDFSFIELEANQEHWRGVSSILHLTIKIFAETKDLIAELKSGKVDLVKNPYSDGNEFEELRQNPNFKFNVTNGTDIVYLAFNTQTKPLDNLKTRQAIAYGIDRQRIINNLLKGEAEIAHSIVPNQSWAYSAENKYDSNQIKARQLLKESGLQDADGDGFVDIKPIVLKVSNGNKETVKIASSITEYLEQIGLPAKIETEEFQTMLVQVKNGDYQLTIGKWVSGNQNPQFLYDLFESSQIPNEFRASRNRSRYKNIQVDALLNEALKETSTAKSQKAFQKAQNIISNDMPLLPLWYPSNVIISNQKVIGDFYHFNRDLTFVVNLTKLP